MDSDGDGETWRNQRKVQVMGAIDILLACGLVLLYLYYSVSFLAGLSPLPGAELSVHLGRVLVLLVGVLVILVNGHQIRVALQLLKSLYPDPADIDQPLCSSSARLWLRTSISLLLVVTVKFFLLTLIPLGETNNLDYFLCLVEFLFRVLGLYFVRELLDDLAAAEVVAFKTVESSKRRKSSGGGDFGKGSDGDLGTAILTPSSKRRIRGQHASIEIPLDEILSNTTMKIVINTSGTSDKEGSEVQNTNKAQVVVEGGEEEA